MAKLSKEELDSIKIIEDLIMERPSMAGLPEFQREIAKNPNRFKRLDVTQGPGGTVNIAPKPKALAAFNNRQGTAATSTPSGIPAATSTPFTAQNSAPTSTPSNIPAATSTAPLVDNPMYDAYLKSTPGVWDNGTAGTSTRQFINPAPSMVPPSVQAASSTSFLAPTSTPFTAGTSTGSNIPAASSTAATTTPRNAASQWTMDVPADVPPAQLSDLDQKVVDGLVNGGKTVASKVWDTVTPTGIVKNMLPGYWSGAYERLMNNASIPSGPPSNNFNGAPGLGRTSDHRDLLVASGVPSEIPTPVNAVPNNPQVAETSPEESMAGIRTAPPISRGGSTTNVPGASQGVPPMIAAPRNNYDLYKQAAGVIQMPNLPPQSVPVAQGQSQIQPQAVLPNGVPIRANIAKNLQPVPQSMWERYQATQQARSIARDDPRFIRER